METIQSIPAPRRRTAIDTLVGVGRGFFALALIGLGVEHAVFEDFVPDGLRGGRPRFLAGSPGPI